MNSECWKYALLVSYVGTRYCGWQKQKGSGAEGGPSIQETIENAIRTMTQDEITSAVGSGRTDAGVHALGQVVHFVLRKKPWSTEVLFKGLNSILPKDIQILDVQEVGLDFHAQRSAVRKQYSYYFQQGPAALPHLQPTSWWIRKRLDLQAMQAALDHLVGEHDFKPFQASGSKPTLTTVRKIVEAQIHWEPLSFPAQGVWSPDQMGVLRMRVMGTGFLKQMVRGIAGTVLQVGEGKRSPDCIREILESRDRNQVGPTAPSRGLWLERVWYDELHWKIG